MAGPKEQELRQALSAQPEEIHRAARAWKAGAQGLSDISDALSSARTRINEAWQGSGADAATAAFATLGSSVDVYRGQMDQAAGALDQAAVALAEAKKAYADLPAPPPEPTAPTPGAGGEVSTQDEVHYLRLEGQRRSVLAAREEQSRVAVAAMDTKLGAASQQLTVAAPPPAWDAESTHAGGGSPVRADAPSGGGPGSAGYRGPGVSGTHVGGYATSDTGTHVATGHLVGSSQVGFGHVPGDVSVDGTVSGVVPGGSGPVLGSGPQMTGSTGSVAAGAVGGVGGLLGGAGGVLGALGRGGSAGTAGVLGGIRGGTSQVLGGVAGEAEELGGTTGAAASRASGVLGGTRGSNVVGGSSGARSGVVAGEGEPGMSGTGARGVTGGTGGTAGRAGVTGGRSATAGGRGLGGAAEEAGGTRGTSTAGGAGRGGVQGSAGGRTDEKDARRKHMKFEDDWLDEDEMGPGVIA